jgi:DNA-binding transcriptional MerR regulator
MKESPNMADETRVRFAEFERSEIDMETGEFPMILATDGEASDGDILSIEGAQFTARAPLQLSHINDPRDTLGTVSGFRRDLQSSPKRLRARGQIELGGQGPSAEIRRDIAHMIQQGHVTGISVRWEPIKYVRRTSLPKEHPAHVKEDDADYRKRYGFYHEKWAVREGSIVAVQADKAAMIGRAESTEGAVSAFWRAMVDDAKPREEWERKPMADEPAPIEVTEPEPAVVVIKPPDESSRLAAFAAQVRELHEQVGVSFDKIGEIISAQRAEKEPTVPDLLALLTEQQTELSAMRAQLASLEKSSRVSGVPAAPFKNVAGILNHLDAMLERSNQRGLAATRAMVQLKTGKIDPALQSYRQAAHAEVEQLLKEARAKNGGPSEEVVALGSMLERMESMIATARAKMERTAAKEK